jgi:phosphoribosylformylglycinamidine synthase PurS subunit
VTQWVAHVRVTLKTAVNDPQGLAIRGGLHQLGFAGVENVRAGKYFDIQVQAPDRAQAEREVDEMCRRLLANPVIEDYVYDLGEPAS